MSQVHGVWNQRSAHLDSNSWSECCRCCFCACCCKKMSRTLRTKLLFVSLHLIGLVSGISLGVYFSSPIENDLVPMDMKYVHQHLLPLFCEGITVESEETGIDVPSSEIFSAYLVDKQPNIEVNKRTRYNETHLTYIFPHGYSAQQFYFLEGSSVRLTGRTDALVNLEIVQGNKNYQQLEDSDFSCSNCFLYSHTLFPSKDFDLTFELAESDSYFFVFKSFNEQGWINQMYHIERATYDTGIYMDACLNETKCHLSFPYFLGQIGVVLEREKSDYTEAVNLEVTCLLRTWVFLVLFFTAPLLLSLLGSCFIFVCCEESTNSTTDASPRITIDPSLQRSRDPLLDGSFHPNYGTVVSPPKYEDIVKSTDDALPSYEEVMGSGQS